MTAEAAREKRSRSEEERHKGREEEEGERSKVGRRRSNRKEVW